MNNQMSMALFHTVLNAKIGDLAFKLYTDPDYGDTYPSIAVVYADGTFEWLENIMGSNTFKFRKVR